MISLWTRWQGFCDEWRRLRAFWRIQRAARQEAAERERARRRWKWTSQFNDDDDFTAGPPPGGP